ncbi:MAG: hypothetical protein ACKOZL_07565 [Actinomycetes bacterium]
MRPIATLATVTALALAACGGSPSSDEGSDTSRVTTTTASTGGGEFAELARRAGSADVRVTYRNGDGDEGFTIAQYDGDSSISFGGDAVYRVDEGSSTCSGAGATAQCFELLSNVDLAGTISQSFFGTYAALFDGLGSSSSPLGSVRTATSRDSIAGRAAECATVSAAVLGRSTDVTVCLDAETGFLLRAVTSDAGDSSGIEATSFRASTAADVTPPAPPQGIPGA